MIIEPFQRFVQSEAGWRDIELRNLALYFISMAHKMTPSPTRFVARLPKAARADVVFDRLRPFARYEPVSGHPDLWLISLKERVGNPRAAWKKLRSVLGSEIAVAPVLIDDEKNFRLPTGALIARFAKDPTDEELAAFSDELGLHVVERNKFVPKQVSFRPANPDAFLPELVDQVRRAKPALVNVWPDTLSQFRRV